MYKIFKTSDVENSDQDLQSYYEKEFDVFDLRSLYCRAFNMSNTDELNKHIEAWLSAFEKVTLEQNNAEHFGDGIQIDSFNVKFQRVSDSELLAVVSVATSMPNDSKHEKKRQAEFYR
ncbi:MAG: hypothetical protein HQK68_11310 [Desulfamplus sp.]|nr:hypothetical protein [Desulfamplus sp.]